LGSRAERDPTKAHRSQRTGRKSADRPPRSRTEDGAQHFLTWPEKGILHSAAGKVRLLRLNELPEY
jgi:hypothetical protein